MYKWYYMVRWSLRLKEKGEGNAELAFEMSVNGGGWLSIIQIRFVCHIYHICIG